MHTTRRCNDQTFTLGICVVYVHIILFLTVTLGVLGTLG